MHRAVGVNRQRAAGADELGGIFEIRILLCNVGMIVGQDARAIVRANQQNAERLAPEVIFIRSERVQDRRIRFRACRIAALGRLFPADHAVDALGDEPGYEKRTQAENDQRDNKSRTKVAQRVHSATHFLEDLRKAKRKCPANLTTLYRIFRYFSISIQ